MADTDITPVISNESISTAAIQSGFDKLWRGTMSFSPRPIWRVAGARIPHSHDVISEAPIYYSSQPGPEEQFTLSLSSHNVGASGSLYWIDMKLYRSWIYTELFCRWQGYFPTQECGGTIGIRTLDQFATFRAKWFLAVSRTNAIIGTADLRGFVTSTSTMFTNASSMYSQYEPQLLTIVPPEILPIMRYVFLPKVSFSESSFVAPLDWRCHKWQVYPLAAHLYTGPKWTLCSLPETKMDWEQPFYYQPSKLYVRSLNWSAGMFGHVHYACWWRYTQTAHDAITKCKWELPAFTATYFAWLDQWPSSTWWTIGVG